MRADKRTGMAKLIDAFRNFASGPKERCITACLAVLWYIIHTVWLTVRADYARTRCAIPVGEAHIS
jgi:hypothetical protein